MPSDPFEGYAPSPSGPYRRATAVTPDDDADLAEVTTALYVGDGGKDIEVILADDADPVTLKAVPAGVLPVRVRRVRATGTTSTSVVALY